jgi:hypothetical protein
MSQHPLGTCIGCGQTDDHPKHRIALRDGSEIVWHHDCHAIATGDPVSAAVAAKGLKGDKLREHIVKNDPGQKVLDERDRAYLAAHPQGD